MKAECTLQSLEGSHQIRDGGKGAAIRPQWLGQRPQEASEHQNSGH